MTEALKKAACIIGTAGHIDHGKTSLVKALTGIDTDRLIEEKKRGVSIDIGFAHLDFESAGARVRAAIIDVPGHERFIKNMLAGTTGIDLVLFVVAADDGIMPQTREHFDIVRLLGIKKGIFVVTKSDLVDPGRVAEVRNEVEGLIKGSVLEASPIIPASAITGAGIEDVRNGIKKGILEAARASAEGRFRLPVDRSFAVKGFGAVVTGTVASGTVAENDSVFLYPQGTRVKVRGIQSLYLKRESVAAGERAALNLSGVGHNEITRGNVLASLELLPFSDFALSGKRMLADCFFEWLPGVKVRNRLLKVHHQADEALCEVRFPGKEISGFGRLALKKPLLMMSGDRFIIRDPSINATIGGGTVFIPYISGDIRKLDKVAVPDKGPTGALRYLLNEKAGVEKAKALLMLNLDEAGLKKIIGEEKEFAVAGGFIVDVKRAALVKAAFVSALEAFHKKSPLEAGMNEGELFKASATKEKKGLLKEILEALVTDKKIKREGNALALVSHRPASAGADAKIEDAIMALFNGGFAQPALDDLKKLPFKKQDVDRVFLYLQRSGRIIRLKEGSFISAAAVSDAREKLKAFLKTRPNIKAAEFRDLLGCGRKLAIEILEYFDKEKVTLRQGDLRVLR